MKASFLTLTALLLATAGAQEPIAPDAATKRPPQHEKNHDPRRGGDFWKKADTNGDQLISRDEFLALPRIAQLPEEKQTKLFSRLDKNGNGTLEAAELRPPHPGHGPKEADPRGGMRGRIMPRIAELDLDKDRKISFAEFTQAPMIAKLPEERQRKMFKNMDRNGDGFLSPEDGPPNRPGPRGEGQPDRANFGPKVMERLDANQDQSLDFSEFQKFPPIASLSEDEQEDRFQKIDANADSKIDAAEWQKHLSSMAQLDRKPKQPKGAKGGPKKGPKNSPQAEPENGDEKQEMEEME